VLTTYNTQKVTFSSAPPGKLPIKLGLYPPEQCNYVILKGGLEDSKGVEVEESGEVNRAVREEKSDDLEAIAFGKKNSLEVPEEFPPKLKDPGSFSIPCMVGNVRIDRAFCDLGVSVSLKPYFIFEKLDLG